MKSNPKIDLESLRVVVTIGEQGSFSKAAQVLHRVPSTISYTVSKLEESLGARIFERDSRQLRLTTQGEALFQRGQELLRMARETESVIADLSNGWEAELRIGVDDLFPADQLMALMRELQAFSPNTRLRICNEVLVGVWDALLADRVDFVIAIDGHMPQVGGFSTFTRGTVSFAFVVAPDHPLAVWSEPIPEDILRRHRVIAMADTARELPQSSIGILPGQPVMTVSTLEMKIQAHLQGMGVGILPRASVQGYLDSGQLVEKQIESGLNWTKSVVYAWKNKHKGKALAWLKERVADPDRPLVWFDR